MNFGPRTSEEDSHAVMDAAHEAGINFFDTANRYGTEAGETETIIGNWFASGGGRRERTVIATKVYGAMGEWPNEGKLSALNLRRALDASLLRLQTDYVDLYQAHRYDYETPLEETMSAFADIVHSGRAHYIGVSEWTAEEISAGHALAQELRIPLVSSQPQYSMLWRVIETEVVPTCRELGIGQIVFSPIAQGVLTGKYKPGAQPPEGSRATDTKGGADMVKRWLRDDVLERVQQLSPLADQAGLSLAQLAIAWVLQNDNVSAAIIGASRPEQVTENVKAAGVRLEADLLKAIDEVLEGVVERDPSRTASPEKRPA
jgi:aryl-alcohol dehydrogenase-like predicted oxidoreductase